MQQGYSPADRQRLDLLADAIVSLDYYLETLEAGRREPVYMLENAQRCLTALHELKPLAAPVAELEPEPGQSGLVATLTLDEPSATVEALDPRALAMVPGALTVGQEPADPEIIELFIEEAGEEITSIQTNFPAWRDNPGNDEALSSLRRSFHTLKGSGRMVGAMLIGEFSWNLENLLNRVINKTQEATGELVSLTAEAVDALPELLEQLEAGTPPVTNIAEIMERVSALVEGREPDLSAAAEPPAAPEVEGSGTVQLEAVDFDIGGVDLPMPEAAAEQQLAAEDELADSSEQAVIDPVLLEILSKEVGGHLDTIEVFLAETAEGTPPFAVPEELYRACHTLHGSVTMAKAELAGELTEPLNRLIRHAYDHDVAVDLPVVDAVRDSVLALRDIVASYADNGTGSPLATSWLTDCGRWMNRWKRRLPRAPNSRKTKNLRCRSNLSIRQPARLSRMSQRW